MTCVKLIHIVTQHRAAIGTKVVRDMEHYILFTLATIDSPHFILLCVGGFAVYVTLATIVTVGHFEGGE